MSCIAGSKRTCRSSYVGADGWAAPRHASPARGAHDDLWRVRTIVALLRPNATTQAAVHHPRRFAAISGVAVLLIGLGSLHIYGLAVAATIGAVGGVLVALLTYALWRPGGPGARWAERCRT